MAEGWRERKVLTDKSRHGTEEARRAEGCRERKVLTDRCRHGTDEARRAEGWRERKVLLTEVDMERRKRDWLNDGGRERY